MKSFNIEIPKEAMVLIWDIDKQDSIDDKNKQNVINESAFVYRGKWGEFGVVKKAARVGVRIRNFGLLHYEIYLQIGEDGKFYLMEDSVK